MTDGEPQFGPVEGRHIPPGNLEPRTLETFIREDFIAAWDSMARCNPMPHTGANFLFARQALAYFELACRTASSWDTDGYLEQFAIRLADRDPRYFTELPAVVPVSADPAIRMPKLPAGPEPERQLLAAIFDLGRHGLGHIYQQIPVTLADAGRWTLTFTGVEPGQTFEDAGTPQRRKTHLGVAVDDGTMRLFVCPDVLMSDLIWAARLSAIFSQHLTLSYLQRPRSQTGGDYEFDSAALLGALDAGGHGRLGE